VTPAPGLASTPWAGQQDNGLTYSYNDDSSDDKRDRYVSSGGIVGHEILINLFEQLWIEETKNLKQPFRSTDCECQHGQFADWKKSDCDAVMARLLNIVCERRGLCPAPIEVFLHCCKQDVLVCSSLSRA
jgi:hypothetical protein